MGILPQFFTEIESCKYLFLREITEPLENALRLLLEEGIVRPESFSREIAGKTFSGLHRIETKDESRLFEVTWDSYVAYSVRNESFVARDETEQIASGQIVRLYSRSHFLDYVSHATFAGKDYPGPLHHIGVTCVNHIIDVISKDPPQVRRVRPTEVRN